LGWGLRPCTASHIVIDRSRAFDHSLGSIVEDWEVWKRILRDGWTTARNPVPYWYRRHATGRSRLRPQALDKVILTTYLTSREDPQSGRRVAPDRWDLVAPWAEGISRCGLRGVILHDSLSSAFIARLQSLGIECVECEPVPATTHTNNWRYRLAAEWLGSQPVSSAFITDLFDVAVKADPFSMLRTDFDLWIGVEPWRIDDTTPAGQWMLSRLNGMFGGPGDLLGQQILNAGIIGGFRAPLLALWWEIWSLVSHRGPNPVVASDMAALNALVYRRLELHRVWRAGAPLHSEFKSYQHDAPVCFVHK